VIDVRRVASFEFPALAEHLARMLRHHEDRGHAERVRHREVAGKILEHGGSPGIDIEELEKAVIGGRRRLWLELRRDDVEHILEMMVELEPGENCVGMAA